MATDIDKLQIEINADSEKANNALDILCDKIGQLVSSLGSLNGTKVKGLDGVQKQAKDAAKSMQPLTEKYKDLGKDFKFFGNAQAAQKKIESLSNAFETARMKKESLEVSGEIGGKMYDKAVREFSMLGNQIENVKKQLEDLRTPKPVENFEVHGLKEYKEEMSEVSEKTKSAITSTSSLKYDAGAMKAVFGEMADGIETYNQAIEKYGKQAGMILNDAFGSNMGTTELSSAAEKAKQLGELLSKLVVPEVREENLTKLDSAISKTEQKLDSLRAKLANGLTMGTISESVDDSGYVRLREQIAMTEKSLEELQAKRSEVESTSGGDGLEKTEKKIRNVGTAAKYTYPKLLDMSGRMRGLTSSFSGGLKSLLKYTVGIRSLYVLFNKLRNGFKEGMKNLVQFSSETNTSVSLLYNSLNQLKNASAAAVSPLLNAVAPALNQIIQLFVNAANAVNQFFAALTGKSTWVKAKVLTDDYAASLESANKAAKNLTTLGIDELNINSGDTSSGSSGTSAGDMFEYEEVSQKWKDFADWFKSMWQDADFTELGEKIGEMLTNALNSIPWETVYEGARNFGKGLATFLNGLISPELFGAVGRTIAGALNTAIYAALSFGETFDWVNLGESIAEGINQFFATFDFKSLAKSINTWVKGIWTTLKTAVAKIKWKTVFKGIYDFIDEIDLGAVFLLAIPHIKTFSKLAKSLSSVFQTLKKYVGNVSDIFSGGFYSGLQKIQSSLSGLQKLGITAVAGFAEFKVVSDTFENLTLGTENLVTAIAKISGVVAVAGTALTAVLGFPAGIVATGLVGLVGALKGVSDAEKELIEQSEIEKYGDTISNLVSKINETSDAVRERAAASLEYVQTAGLAETQMASDLAEKYFELAGKESLTNEEKEKMKNIASELVDTLPGLEDYYNSETGLLDATKESVEALIQSRLKEIQLAAVEEQLKQAYQDQSDQLIKLQQAIELANDDQKKMNDLNQEYQNLLDKQDALEEYNNLSEQIIGCADDTSELLERHRELEQELTNGGLESIPTFESLGTQINIAEQNILGFKSEYESTMSGLANAEGAYESVSTNIEQLTEMLTSGMTSAAQDSAEGYATALNEDTSMADAALNQAKALLEAFRSSDGINSHSPSKAFQESGKDSIDGYVLGLTENEKNITQTITKIANNLLSKFKELLTPMYDIGVNAMQGLYNGLASMEGTLYAKAQSIADNIAKTIKSALDIHSPSRVMAELGVYTMQGFQRGMESLYDPIVNSLQKFSFDVQTAPVPTMFDYSAYTPMTLKSSESAFSSRYIDDESRTSDTLLREQNELLRQQNELLSYLADKEIVARIDPDRETIRGFRNAEKRLGFSFT